MKLLSHVQRSVIVLSGLLLLLSSAFVVAAADVQSTWDGSVNVWHSASNWSHNAPSLLGYPSNGVQSYDVRIDAGEVILAQTGNINGLELHGGRLVLQRPMTVQSNF